MTLNFEALLSSAALAMDAFAVSLCTGACLENNYNLHKAAGQLGLAFGFFQFVMPLIGWFMGEYAQKYIASFAPWLAFIILSLVGGNMIYEFFKNKNNNKNKNFINPASSVKVLISMAVATSIDALMVGAGFAFAGFSVIYLAVCAGIITTLECITGVYLGRVAGAHIGEKAGLFGGIILILIGVNILLK